MRSFVFFNDGGPGGCGKSLNTSLELEALSELGLKTVLVETDANSPDTLYAYGETCENHYLDLLKNKEEGCGFKKLGRLISEYRHTDKIIVVNGRPGLSTLMHKYGHYLKKSETSVSIHIFYAMTARLNAVLALERVAEVFDQKDSITVIKSGRDFDLSEYAIYDYYLIGEKFLNDLPQIAKSEIYVPKIPELLLRYFYNHGMSWQKAYCEFEKAEEKMFNKKIVTLIEQFKKIIMEVLKI